MSIWASGPPYEAYVGRWSRRVAQLFLPWLDVPNGSSWLDVGCGTGALTEAVLRDTAPSAVAGIDASAGFVGYAREQLTDERVTFEVADAASVPFEDDRFDAVVSGLVLNFLPDPAAALAEMARVVRPGGTVAVYVWDYAEGMQLMRHFWEAAAALDPVALQLDEGVRFPICRPEPLAALWRAAQLGQVTVRAIDVPTVFRDFDAYWSPFLGAQGPAPSYAMGLDEVRRATLKEEIRARCPVAEDGSIHLQARAWAVQGRVRPAD